MQSESNLVELVRNLIEQGRLTPRFRSKDLLILREESDAVELGLKNFAASSLATFPANASVTDPSLGYDLGMGVPVERGLQSAYFWRVGKVGKAIEYELIPNEKIIRSKQKRGNLGTDVHTEDLKLALSSDQMKTLQAASIVLDMSQNELIVSALNQFLGSKGLKTL